MPSKALIAILFCAPSFAAPAGAATCGGDFNAFLSAMGREATAAGISRTVLDSAFAGVLTTPSIPGTLLAPAVTGGLVSGSSNSLKKNESIPPGKQTDPAAVASGSAPRW